MSPEERRRRDRFKGYLKTFGNRLSHAVDRRTVRRKFTSWTGADSEQSASPYQATARWIRHVEPSNAQGEEGNPVGDRNPAELTEDVPKCRYTLERRRDYWTAQPSSHLQQDQLAIATALLQDFEEFLGFHKAGVEPGDSIIAARFGFPSDPSTPYHFPE